MSNYKKGFGGLPIYLASSPDRDTYRWIERFVMFSEGYAYATDRSILVKAKIENVCTLQEDEIKMLDGLAIPAYMMKKLSRKDIVSISMESREYRKEGYPLTHPETSTLQTAVLSWKENDGTECKFALTPIETLGKLPNFEAIMVAEKEEVTEVVFNTDKLDRMRGAMGLTAGMGLKLVFNGNHKAAMAYPREGTPTGDVVGLIMPILA